MRKSLQISKRKQKKFHCERERERERERETPSKLERRALTLLLSRLRSQVEIPELGLIMRSHVRSQKPGLTMRFQLRCQRHCTFPPRELSRVDDILPGGMPPPLLIGVPNRDPKIRSYSEVSFEASETRSCNEIPIEMSKTLYFSTMGSVQGR